MAKWFVLGFCNHVIPDHGLDFFQLVLGFDFFPSHLVFLICLVFSVIDLP